ncbi:MAG TPA: YIP1 family protein [Gaiellaceae bacterium]|nr:YIP1 family protein [Gaiellaceae bacterium]
MSVRTEAAPHVDEWVWLRRAVLVLVRPREVLEGLRDDSDPAARARSEAVLALVLLGGIGSVLWTPVAQGLMDVDGAHAEDGVDVALWAFLGGALNGVGAYFVGGFVLYALARVVGGITYRQARHLLAFAAAPIALSLFVLWPVRLAVYGEALFRSGGSDRGLGNAAFVAVGLAFAVWSLVLLGVGARILLRR